MVGIDTGFFVGLMKGDPKPIEFWASLVDSDTLPVISMLTLGELLYISIKEKLIWLSSLAWNFATQTILT